MISESEHQKIVTALYRWVNRLPEPELPVLAFADEGEFTARKLADEVAQRSEVGESFLEILEYSIRRTSLSAVIGRFEHGPEDPSEPPTASAGLS